MMKKNLLGFIAILGIIAASCSTPKDITYMQGFSDNAVQAVTQQKRITVLPDDKLSIIVSSKDPALAEVFNLSIAQTRIGQASSGSNSSNSQISAYTVDPNGYIQFPVIGEVYVRGLQKSEVAEKIKNELIKSNMLKDPTVTVEFLNATVSVLGDVKSPGEYVIDKENLNIIQALSKAGDLNITGMRENVLVIREGNGKNRAYRVDLTNTAELMQSPAYYLQQNDIVYVEPNNMKKREAINNANTLLTPTFWMSVASFLTTIGVLIFK